MIAEHCVNAPPAISVMLSGITTDWMSLFLAKPEPTAVTTVSPFADGRIRSGYSLIFAAPDSLNPVTVEPS